MAIRIKRIYDPPSPCDGRRILVDRIWPRGVRRGEAKLDDWVRELAPSDELRKWFDHDEERWEKFRERYLAELKEHHNQVQKIATAARNETITLLFAAKDVDRNNAVVLSHYLEMFDSGKNE